MLFAEKIARERDIVIPDETKASSAAVSAWIASNLSTERGKGRHKTDNKRTRSTAPPWTPWTILCRLDRHHPSYATCIRVDGANRCDPHADPIGRVRA